MIFLQMVTRRDLSDSATELDEEVRPINSFSVAQNVVRSVSGKYLSISFVDSELKKPGMASKNSSSDLSSPRALIVQSKIRMSTFDDRSNMISSAAFSTPSVIQLR